MQLKDYLNMKRGSSKALATKLEVSTSYLSQMASGIAAISPSRAIQIEQLTEGAVTRADCFPDDWETIWPEFIPPTTPLTNSSELNGD
ncbi:YdaS family helix-turn-helix protein [Klebsiella pneumoniae]|uniref:Helix-turn-helix domain-containing protein n=3 Tax=Klebsiella pneumoniae TaxID=573 RepID=A0A9Q4Y9F5_KLEPN|nr:MULTISPECIES: YdaS family helix-turn-helix protein [Klebsiella]MDR8470192.1 helix-turn-helix domain-containing protein [Acinetobacter baumannii]DAL00186.1 MAG TPA: Putative antitoxin of bacterial toxin-antitoxin system, YdaS/YdaT [Caudoviricetes sp.]HAP2493009.1 helix-turn-helix domain-containing protein [Escherichia coli]HBQ6650477.1 helix-turn-helix domain-containing protein [Klebsiella quasipneumoniae subsp. quasipneumoniae]AVS19268.1 helix-turn-helix domain-containing protein [Klebsiell